MRSYASISLCLLTCVGLATLAIGCSEDGAGVPPTSQGQCTARARRPADVRIEGLLHPLRRDARPEFAEILRQRDIAGDPRSVLPGVPSAPAFRHVELSLPADAKKPFQTRVPLNRLRFSYTKRVLVAPRIRLDDWIDLEPHLLSIERDDRGRFVELDIDLSAYAGHSGGARLTATVFAAPAKQTIRYEAPALRFDQPDGWLEFAVGIPEIARDQGPVRFRLEACANAVCECLHEEIVDPEEEAGAGWQDRLLPIGDLAGRSLSLAFESETVRAEPAGFVIAQWEAPRILVEREATEPAPLNVLLVSLDTLGAGHLGSFGYARDTSPFMSGELARAGTLFTNAIAPSTTTAPSHMTLFTSLQPSIHGVASNLRKQGLPEGIPTLASALSDAGYATGSVNENGAISLGLGFGRGFDHYAVLHSATVIRPEGFVGDIFDAGLRYVDRHPHQPWFLFLHTYEVHYPYTPPAAYAPLFPEGDGPQHPDNRPLGRGRKRQYPVLYDREIRHVDAQLERLFEGLRARGVLDDTIVVVTADHGEAFFEHHFLGHGSDVHQETTHVPLYVTGPGIARGERIDLPISLLDLMPTLLELVGAPAPEGSPMMGRSFAPILRGETADPELARRPIVSEAWHPTATGRRGPWTIIPPTLGVRRGPYKLIRYKGKRKNRYEFFDLSEDPHERKNLFGAGGPVVDELRAIADAYEAESRAITRALDLPPLVTEIPDVDELDPERVDALKALGYIE